MKQVGLGIFISLVVFVAAFIAQRWVFDPPGKRVLVQRFEDNRRNFDRLRSMIAEDEGVTEVAEWGVRTTNGATVQTPPISELSSDRYKAYLATLQQIGALGVSRSGNDSGETCVLIWAHGFAGDTRHFSACWLPTGGPAPFLRDVGRFSYAPLGDHWYLQQDF